MGIRWLGAAVVLLGLGASAGAQSKVVILATTTSTQDAGLLDALVPAFERRTGYTVKTIAVGTGQALALAARGEADVALAHAPELEKKYVAEGFKKALPKASIGKSCVRFKKLADLDLDHRERPPSTHGDQGGHGRPRGSGAG